MFDIDRLLQGMAKPARYTGNEWNSIVKDWEQSEVRVALCYPDLYEVGMCNLGLSIIYDVLNRQERVLCERVFAPWVDMSKKLRETGIPLYSLESRHALNAPSEAHSHASSRSPQARRSPSASERRSPPATSSDIKRKRHALARQRSSESSSSHNASAASRITSPL